MQTTDEQFSFDDNFLNCIRYIHEVRIFNEIQNSKKILIFDFRNREEYFMQNLGLSLNIPFDEHDFEFYQALDDKKIAVLDKYTDCCEVKQRLKSFKRYFIVLLMSETRIKRKTIENCLSEETDSLERDKIIKTLLFYKALVKQGVREIGIFNLGINKLASEYGFMINKSNTRTCIK